MKPCQLMKRPTPFVVFALLLAAACADQPDATSPVVPEFAKGGPNAPPTNKGRIFFASRMTVNSEIFSINPDGTELRRLTFTPGEEQSPAVSPDGRKVAFLRGLGGAAKSDLWIMNADGSRPQLVYTVPPDVYNIYTPTWTPDGRMITFSYIEANSPNGRRIASSFAWSPDAAKIAASDGTDLYVALANGSGAVKILPGAQVWSGLSWSR